MPRIILDLHEKYIQGTSKGEIVKSTRVFLCNLTFATQRGLDVSAHKVYVSTRCLKHSYDKRPAQEYDFLAKHLHKVVKYPDYVYENKNSKRGDFCFVKRIDGALYFCSVELAEHEEEHEDVDGALPHRLEVVTFFRVPKEKYLDTYTLLWSWRDDNDPSS